MREGNSDLTQSIHPVLRFITDPKYRWLRHLVFITVCLVLAFKGDVGQKEYLNNQGRVSILIADAILFVAVMSLLYLVILVLIPRLLFRSSLLVFFLCLFVIAVLIYFLVAVVENYFVKPVLPPSAMYEYADFTFIDFIQ